MGNFVLILAIIFLLIFLFTFTKLNHNPHIEGYEASFDFTDIFSLRLKVKNKKKNTEENDN